MWYIHVHRMAYMSVEVGIVIHVIKNHFYIYIIHTYNVMYCTYINDRIVKSAQKGNNEKSPASSVSPQTGMDFPVVQF